MLNPVDLGWQVTEYWFDNRRLNDSFVTFQRGDYEITVNPYQRVSNFRLSVAYKDRYLNAEEISDILGLDMENDEIYEDPDLLCGGCSIPICDLDPLFNLE